MQKIKSLLIGIPVAVLVGTALVTPLATAEREDSSPSSDIRHEVEDDTSRNERSYVREVIAYENDSEGPEDNIRREIRDRGESEANKLRSEQKRTRTKQERTDACKARLSGMEMRFSKLAESTNHLLTRANDINSKLETYKSTSQANIENWPQLQKAVSDAQSLATASVNSVAALKPTVDCTKETVANDIATFKAAVEKARDDLKAYRNAMKDMIVALNTNQPKTETTTTEMN